MNGNVEMVKILISCKKLNVNIGDNSIYFNLLMFILKILDTFTLGCFLSNRNY